MSLDLTGFTNLTTVNCSNAGLTNTLDVTGLLSLTTLNCSSNASLTTLTLTGCTALTTLDCNSCAITTLDTSTLTILDFLNCSDNLLTALDLTPNLILTYLAVNGNNIGSTGILNISTCTALIALSCYDNPSMVSLDLSTNSVISILDTYNCGLTSLKMGSSSGYSYVDASDNSLPTGPNGVDSVLSDLKTNCLANAGTCNLNTPATNASPTGGLLNADYVALTGAGWTVSIN